MNDILLSLSNQMADTVAAIAPSVVQVQGRRRPASGVVYAADVVLTTVRALGREDGLRVRTHDGRALDAELAGWDPATGLAVLLSVQLSARQRVLAPDALDEVGILVAEAATPVRLPIAPAILDEGPD